MLRQTLSFIATLNKQNNRFACLASYNTNGHSHVESEGFPSASILSLRAMGWVSGGDLRVLPPSSASGVGVGARLAEYTKIYKI